MLGWVTRRHVTFGGSAVTLGIRVTGLLVILCGWSGGEGLDRQLACMQGCPAALWTEKSLGCSEEPRPKLRDEASLRRG